MFRVRWLAPLVVHLAVALVAVRPAQAAEPTRPRTRSILVLDVKGDPAVVDAGTLTTLTSTLAASVSQYPALNVVTSADVKNLVDIEAQKQLLGCSTGAESCLAEVANALGAELVMSGDVGKLGSSFIVNLQLFDAAAAKSIGRETLPVPDLAQLPPLLQGAVASLLAPVVGKAKKAREIAVPTVDLGGVQKGGLKINLAAEKALEAALDAQDSATAAAEAKRDAWCALKDVGGANPYLAAATKACGEWADYVSSMATLRTSIADDYRTLAGFLQLRRKTKEQRLEAVDAFIAAYGSLQGQPEIDAAREARQRVVDGIEVIELPEFVDHDGDGVIVGDRCPNEAEDKDGHDDDDGCAERDPDPPPDPSKLLDNCLSPFGCLALNLDATPQVGLVLGAHVPVLDDPQRPEKFSPDTPSLVFGTRLAWAFIEGGVNLDVDFNNGSLTPADDGGDEREVLFLFHGYAGLQTFTVRFGGFTLLRPSIGFDAYSNAFEANDFGLYVANTFTYDLAQLRVFARSHAAGERVVRAVQIGVELSLDYLRLFED